MPKAPGKPRQSNLQNSNVGTTSEKYGSTRQQHVSRLSPKLVESTNALQPSDFFVNFVPAPTAILERITRKWPGSTSPISEISLTSWVQLSQNGPDECNLLEQCLDLTESTSAEAYKRSEIKWSRTTKKKEMQLPDMRYIILLDRTEDLSDKPEFMRSSNRAQPLSNKPLAKMAGFVSFMVTYEDNHEVMYIYEIHFQKPYQGKGLGRILMDTVEEAAMKIGLEKIMLTVFRENVRASSWYQESLGYGVDDYSPQPRVFRDGTVKESGYLILSKALGRESRS